MLFLLGIPKTFYEDVKRAVAKALPGDFVAGLPFDGQGRPSISYFEDCFDTLVAFHNGRPQCFQKGLAVIALQFFGGGDFSSAAEAFFPFALFKAVDHKARLASTGKQMLRDKNELVRIVLAEAKRAVKLKNKVTTYLHSKANRTPLLLPIEHFGGDELRQMLAGASNGLQTADDPNILFETVERLFEAQHPFHKKKTATGFFVNANSVEFRSPGRDLHGVTHANSGDHNHLCFLNGSLRIGGQIKTGFHYDCCQKDGKPHGGTFIGCHAHPLRRQGKPHLNVYSNDYIR
ncbi:hypothetical protein [Pararhizobium sp.]|uniref:hypothetical protein n=1 Tax=Pararhizobium sp. TaxID=1977563 RepID=UPI003D13449C